MFAAFGGQKDIVQYLISKKVGDDALLAGGGGSGAWPWH